MSKREKASSQTKLEEWFNSLSHGITGLAAIGGLVVLIVFGAKSDNDWSLFSAIFYGSSLVLLYTFSSIYHGLRHKTAKYIFNILDHCGIYLLIAGTYTPVLLISIGGPTGWMFFGIQWGMALIGIILKVFYTGKYNLISTIMYAFMGWIIVFKIELVKEVLPTPAFWLLASGGVAYTLGIIFYIIDNRMRLAHFIWHLFVMAGSLLHFIMMVKYIFR
ncbi:hemolysin III family protein [Marinoscillum sp. MHG1-6]|uniref:PAQR family membrane homeostasis protein TrhA n=1 Tax=Marinoscillum sp. MHG1-6 TaxID=2959627 RepID=UPI0021587AD7|nr:hemolysin III family protein [Marinoscillum sp. MHG1-6]